MAGEFDPRDGAYGITQWAQKMLGLNDSYWNQARKVYHLPDGTVGGTYYQQDGSDFTLATIPTAGHMLPYFNYEAPAAMIKDFTTQKKLLCRDCSVTDKKCAYLMTN